MKRRLRAFFLLSLPALLTGCSRYAEFTLPPLAGPSGGVKYEWTVLPEPVLTRGGDWDRVDALNPSIIRTHSEYRNYYSGYDGKSWRTGWASSPDGRTWQKQGKLLSPDPATWEGEYIAANGSALWEQGKALYWYQGGRTPRIGLVKDFVRHGDPVLGAGPRGSWDERGVADPYVIRAGQYLYMYFLGQDRARRQRLGVARSRDGIVWEKYRGNPIVELGEPGKFDELGLGEPAVWSQHGWYWMLYTGRDRKEFRRLGLARSKDGIGWNRVTDQPVLEGAQPWDSKVVCDPSVLVNGDEARVWFGGGDKAEPAENLNGAIGYATLKITLAP